jgi:predicted dehydrogenase
MAQSTHLHFAVIGFGYWGPNIVRNLIGCPDVGQVTVVDLSTERLAQARKQFPNITTTSDLAAVLKDPSVNAVIVATPSATHFKLGQAALQAGKDVLIEKPLATTRADAAKLLGLAKRYKRLLAVDHTFIYTPAVQKMKALMSRKNFGQPLYYDSMRVNLGLFQNDVNVLWDLAPHDLSIIDYLFTPGSGKVVCTGAKYQNSQHEALAFMTVYYDTGLVAHINTSWVSPVKLRTVLIGGSKKMFLYDDIEPTEKIKIYDKGIDRVRSQTEIYSALWNYRVGDVWIPTLSNHEALRQEMTLFAQSIKQRSPMPSNGQMGYRIVSILEAAEKSLRNGKAVRFTV